jgi:hypothetical protein
MSSESSKPGRSSNSGSEDGPASSSSDSVTEEIELGAFTKESDFFFFPRESFADVRINLDFHEVSTDVGRNSD